MDQDDYYAQIQREALLRKSKIRRILIISFSIVVVLLIIAWAVNRFGNQFLVSKYNSEHNIPQASVVISGSVSWRTLAHHPITLLEIHKIRSEPFHDAGMFGGLVVADFTGDGNDDALWLGNNRGILYEMSGNRKSSTLCGKGFLLLTSSWDYDGDGVAEAVPAASMWGMWKNPSGTSMSSTTGNPGSPGGSFNLPTTTPIFNLAGNRVTDLNGVNMGQEAVLVGDYDGDGQDDLWLADHSISGSSKCLVYAPGGTEIGRFAIEEIVAYPTLGDVDGDGKDELICIDGMQGGAIIGADQDRRAESNLGFHALPSACADLNGDGRAEIILCGGSYIDTTSQIKTNTVWPTGVDTDSARSSNAIAGDFDRNGTKEIAVSTSPAPFGTGLMLFDTTGQCIYYEEFGKIIWSMNVAQVGGQDHLVLQLSDRIIVYP